MGRKPRSLIGWRSIVVCTLLGAFLAVLSVPVSAVAHRRWGTPLYQQQGSIDVYVEHDDHFLVTSWTWDLGAASWFTVYEGLPPGASVQSSSLFSGQPRSEEDPRPAFARLGYPGRERTVGVFQNGFPFLAAQGRRVTTMGPVNWSGGTGSDEWLYMPTYKGVFYIIPYRPMWIGLLGNVVVYTLLLLGPLIAWRLWRRSRRVSEGHCERCGYDLVGIDGPCPECGASRDRLDGAPA